MEVTLTAEGHEHVTGTHGSTVEVTTDEYLTPAGDCIVGIKANMAPVEFPSAFKSACQHRDATISMAFTADGIQDRVAGRGDPALTFASERSLVVRTSTFIDDRTVVVDASGAAKDLDRDLIDALAAGANLSVTVHVDA